MDPRTRRQLILAATLMVALIAAVLMLKGIGGSDDDSGDTDGADQERGGNGLSAISKGGDPEESGLSAGSTGTPAEDPIEVNPLNLISGRTQLPMSVEQVERALDSEARSKESLIAAHAVLGNHAYLLEAAQNHPDDSSVQYQIVLNNADPDRFGEWLGRLKESDPDNALPNLLAAREAFRQQDPAAALAELKTALAKQVNDPNRGLSDKVKQLYDASGEFDSESAWYASAKLGSAIHLPGMSSLSNMLIEHHKRLSASGEDQQAAEVIALGTQMADMMQEVSAGRAVREQAMALLMQENLLRAAGDPDGRLDQVVRDRESLAQLNEDAAAILRRDDLLSPVQLRSYTDRLYEFGEAEAKRWLVDEVGEISPE